MADRKLAFIEIGKGKLGLDIQADFEQAVLKARELNGKCVVELKINVYPPQEGSEGRIGTTDYSHRIVEPAKKSAQFMTLMDANGVVINSGENEGLALQYALELPSNIHPMPQREAQ